MLLQDYDTKHKVNSQFVKLSPANKANDTLMGHTSVLFTSYTRIKRNKWSKVILLNQRTVGVFHSQKNNNKQTRKMFNVILEYPKLYDLKIK